MMRKSVHIIFTLVLLIGTTGMTISKHYCGTSLKSISVNISPDNCCDESKGCCHNESFTIQLEDEFSLVSNTFDFSTLDSTPASPSKLIQDETVKVNSNPIEYLRGHPPKIQEVLSRLQVYLL